jgi:hypothetical protein
MMMSIELIYELIGLLGMAAIVGAYLFLNLDVIQSNSRIYHLANAVGASLVIISLVDKFNLAAFILEAFWLAISLFGLWRLRQQLNR